MKLLLEIKEDKAEFILELLRNFPFVKTKMLTPEKAEFLAGIKEAAEEMKLVKEGKVKAISARDLADEL